jgi:hypothetical protein
MKPKIHQVTTLSLDDTFRKDALDVGVGVNVPYLIANGCDEPGTQGVSLALLPFRNIWNATLETKKI